jgi:hypothetical protein
MLPSLLEIERYWGMVGEGGEAALDSVKDCLIFLTSGAKLSLFVGRKACKIHHVEVSVLNGANGCGVVVLGPG